MPKFMSIGIGDVSRHMISKALLDTITLDFEKEARAFQMCAFHDGVCEATMNAIRQDSSTRRSEDDAAGS